MNKFDQLIKAIKKNNILMLNYIQKIEVLASKSGNESLNRYLKKENKNLTKSIRALEERSNELHLKFDFELNKKTMRLKKQIDNLHRAKESAISNNILLEYKKKDLQQLAADLEDAYEEISKQAQELQTVHQEIIEKNEQMEEQTEVLLDQTDYLQEANKAITRMHEEVQSQKEELISLNNEKNNLIGIVAHDLKSPLSQVKGLVMLIKMTSTSLDDESTKYIELIEQSTDRLINMITKILDVEALESNQVNLTIEKINLSELTEIIFERFKTEADAKNIVLHPDIKKNIFASVDKGYVDQIFQNLFSNAIKFSPTDKNIYIRLNVVNHKVVFEVKDEGPGLTEEDKKMLFGKYQKLSAKPTGNETSTGLGLSIVKKFVEAMNGQIWCESDKGNGASFFVSFNTVA